MFQRIRRKLIGRWSHYHPLGARLRFKWRCLPRRAISERSRRNTIRNSFRMISALGRWRGIHHDRGRRVPRVRANILPVKRQTSGIPIEGAVLLFLLALFGGLFPLPEPFETVVVFMFTSSTQGIAYLHFGKSGVCRWGDVNEFYRNEANLFALGLPIKRRNYLMVCNGGEHLRFTRGLRNVEALADTIEQATLERLLRRSLFELKKEEVGGGGFRCTLRRSPRRSHSQQHSLLGGG